jgi:hypothetical protein
MYWERQSEYTPESRIETHESMKKKRENESKEFVFFKTRSTIIFFIFCKAQKPNQNQSVNISVMMVIRSIAMNRSISFLIAKDKILFILQS